MPLRFWLLVAICASVIPLNRLAADDVDGLTTSADLSIHEIAHFRFNGDGEDAIMARPAFELANVEFTDGALKLNGRYEFTDEGGYRAIGKTPDLSYRGFSIAMRFKAESFEGDATNLITGGRSHRWFGLHRTPDGDLTVTLNNQEYSRELDGLRIEQGKWTVIACSVDVVGKRVAVSLNGAPPVSFDLPADFKLAVVEAEPEVEDKVWTFTDYSNGQVFHGLVDELVVYGKPLPIKSLHKLLNM